MPSNHAANMFSLAVILSYFYSKIKIPILKHYMYTKNYTRKTKKKFKHFFNKKQSDKIFMDCKEEFKRDKGKVDPKRLDNAYYHVCPSCDPKRFAQKKGVERRKTLDSTIDTLVTLDTL